MGLKLICEYCHKQFITKRNRVQRYCSNSCSVKANPKPNTGKTHFNNGHIPWNKGKEYYNTCEYCNKKYRVKKCQVNTSRYCSISCSKKEKRPWNYNPDLDRTERKDLTEAKEWSLNVKKQGNFKCDICGFNKKLNSHHIESWDKNKELRFDLDNGVCLCKECHVNFHKTFGFGNNNINQYIKFKEELQ